jgi:hypothetical protein
MVGRTRTVLVVALTGVVLLAGCVAFAARAAERSRVDARASAPLVDSVSAPAGAAVAAEAAGTNVTPSDPASAQSSVPAVDVKAAPARVVIPEMKHVWQSLNNCGPASVVMALSTFGVDVSQEEARIPLRGSNVLSGMGPQRVDGWVKENFGLRSVWRNNGSNEMLRRLVANGFAPMVTQWMQDPSISRIAHWRVVRGYDNARATFYVNDPMLGNGVPLGYQWFQDNWQPFSYRYMVIFDPKDEALLKAIVGDDWNDVNMRQNFYERAKDEARAQDTMAAWIAYGEAAYGYGMFAEAVEAFEHALGLGSVQGVFTLRSSYPQALRALGRHEEADRVAQRLSTNTSSSTVASPPDPFALYLAFVRAHEGDQVRLSP